MTVTANTISYPDTGFVPASATFRAEKTGDVTAYFYGSTATFTEEVGFAVNGVPQGGWALPNHGSLFGDSINFGAVHAGDVLTFLLHVDDTGNTFSFRSGDEPRWNQSRIREAICRRSKRRPGDPGGRVCWF